MTVLWPEQRADVLAGLAALASGTSTRGQMPDLHSPSLTNAVHWVVDDTFWDRRDPAGSIGTLLLNAEEAEAVAAVVREVVSVSERQGPEAADRAWLDDEAWPRVRAAAEHALDIMRRGS